MIVHKSRPPQGAICGGAPDGVLGGARGGTSSMYWDSVTCPDCLALKPPGAGGRTSIKRSHRAEGENFVD